jgi:predicted DNA-binding transcriptional regulator AlpA
MRWIIERIETENNDRRFTAAELAREFDVSRQTIHNWIQAGRFPNSFEVGQGGGKVVIIPASDVEAVKQAEAEKLLKQFDRLGFQTVPA